MVVEYTLFQYRIMETIVNHENEIEKSMLPTAKITTWLNENKDRRFHVSGEVVGKAASALGLEKKKLSSGNARGFVITIEKLKEFKQIFKA